MNKDFLCIECAHERHQFELLGNSDCVLIDKERWILRHRSPSQKVKCSDCGKQTRYAFERR